MALFSNEDTPARCDGNDTSTSIPQTLADSDQYSGSNSQVDDHTDRDSKVLKNLESPLLLLPPELLQQILSYLSPQELAPVSAACRVLAEHATNDLLWANLVNAHLPFKVYDPGPFDSFRELYIAHHPCWFIPRNKIWFSDKEHTGSLILGRYDNRRGIIEAYRIVAERQSRQFQFWTWNPEVMIQSFNPKVGLWLDDPVLLLKNAPSGSTSGLRYLNGEMRMPMALELQRVFSSFSFCSREIPSHTAVGPKKQWPPLTIPTDRRVYRGIDDTHMSELDEIPKSKNQISEAGFRLRRWPHFGVGTPYFTSETDETLSTYATLDPGLYTPTKEKPYQGIWVGDYSAHGCEFLLFLQRDHEGGSTSPATNSTSRGSVFNESVESESETEDIVHQGSLEAIKLTGDPNVPRGQISFVADDIGQGGLVRTAEESLFEGARIVHSKGHVAGLGFRDGKCSHSNADYNVLTSFPDTFVTSQLILISLDCVAHYWETQGHVSYFRRVDIDSLIQT